MNPCGGSAIYLHLSWRTNAIRADCGIEQQDSSLNQQVFDEHRNANATDVQPHLAADIAKARGRLGAGGTSNDSSLDALSSLSRTSAAVWRDTSKFEDNLDFVDGFFLFEDRTSAWVDCK
jgi:hypothetical protein